MGAQIDHLLCLNPLGAFTCYFFRGTRTSPVSRMAELGAHNVLHRWSDVATDGTPPRDAAADAGTTLVVDADFVTCTN